MRKPRQRLTAHAPTEFAMIPGAALVKIAAKSTSRESYVREFKAALDGFLAK